LNVALKEYVYSMPFFVGTAGTHMSPSIVSMAQFFVTAVLSIFQINSGERYLAGALFADLPSLDKLFVLIVLALILLSFLLFLLKTWKSYKSRIPTDYSRFFLFIFLFVLFGFMLVPAVSTIRLEQRWLMASAAILVLLIVVALDSIQFTNNRNRNIILGVFAVLFLATDVDYMRRGGDNFYMVWAEKDAAAFKEAIKTGVIIPETDELDIFVAKKDPDLTGSYVWFLLDGHLFEFYQGKIKKLVFVDSADRKNSPIAVLAKFKRKKAQVVRFELHKVTDVTQDFADSVAVAANSNQNKDHLLMTADDLLDREELEVSGFYAVENLFRWTSGKASIKFKNEYTLHGNVVVELNTYMPPVCKDIVPKLMLKEKGGREILPESSSRKENKFIYTYNLKQPVQLQQIDILSDTIVQHTDTRRLSFPFVSLKLDQ